MLYAGTNSPQQKSSESRTQLELFLNGTSCEVDAHKADETYTKVEGVKRLRLLFRGNEDCAALVSLLRFAADTLESQSGGDTEPAKELNQPMPGFEAGF